MGNVRLSEKIHESQVLCFCHGTLSSWLSLELFSSGVLTILTDTTLMSLQATDEKDEMESLRAYNLKLVANILPLHVAQHFLKRAANKDEVSSVLYPGTWCSTSRRGPQTRTR